MEKAVADAGVFFQLGFMRRFDKAYAAAREKDRAGRDRDPDHLQVQLQGPISAPRRVYSARESSGGLFIDMGIHDFDLARWYLGEVKSVHSAGASMAYPEISTVGDVESGFSLLHYASGGLGMISLSRAGIYGYGIETEIMGTKGTIKIGYDRRDGHPHHDRQRHLPRDKRTLGFYERFEQAYIQAQLQNFVDNLRNNRPSPIVCEDGIAAQKNRHRRHQIAAFWKNRNRFERGTGFSPCSPRHMG